MLKPGSEDGIIANVKEGGITPTRHPLPSDAETLVPQIKINARSSYQLPRFSIRSEIISQKCGQPFVPTLIIFLKNLSYA